MFLVGWWLAVREDKKEATEKKKEKKRDDAHWQYHHNKWTNPTSQKVVNAAKLDNRNHQEFLKKQVSRIENEYRSKGIYPGFPQIENFHSSDDRIDALFATPEKYIAVTKSIGRKPIQELIEDWRAQVHTDHQVKLLRDQAIRRNKEINHAKLLDIKCRILEKIDLGFSRKEIIDQMKSELSGQREFVISRENNIWHVELDGDAIRFKAPSP